MNERILDICIKAGINTWPFNEVGFISLDESELVKFAELIVRECVGILMTPEYPMNHPEELADYNRGWVNGRLLGIEHIREHFEVES